MGKKRKQAKLALPEPSVTLPDDLPVWLRVWISAFPRAGIDVSQRLDDWRERRTKSVPDYFGVAGLEDAHWDKDFRDVLLTPGPDGTQGKIVDPMLLVPCRSGRSSNCVKSTTRRAFYYYRGRVTAAVPICGHCHELYKANEFLWRPGLVSKEEPVPLDYPAMMPWASDVLDVWD